MMVQLNDRIVSITQPHIRPIVRGKAKAATEFGAKVAISRVDGYMYVDELSWDPFNESVNLKQAAEDYKARFGYYPEAILADQIYRNRDNRAFCKKEGIRLSGPALGRPKVGEVKYKERTELQDMRKRIWSRKARIWFRPDHGTFKRDGRECNCAAIHCHELRASAQGSFLPFLHFSINKDAGHF